MEEEFQSFPTESEIRELPDELMDLLMLMETHKVPSDGLNTVEELKERLILEYRRRQGARPKKLIAKGMVESSEENRTKRQRLIEVFNELLKILERTDVENSNPDCSDSSSVVDEFLSAEGTTDNIKKDCQAKIKDLEKGDCVILIAGETSAGKSSLLNLLLETQGLLPTAVISCTSTITSIRYGDTRRALVVYNDPGRENDVIENLDKEGVDRLHKVAFMRGDERETGHGVKEVQVFLPLWFLKTGIVLADTPGIGENDFMEDYLHQYIAHNEILGFIYVIMSDAAGGVKEDRLLLLLRLIMEEQKKNKKGLPFNPNASLFVCNRFDAIPEDEQGKVKSHIIDQLSKNWPEFDPNMAVFFSTMNAKRDVEAHEDYISDQYKLLLEALSSLFTIAADRQVKASYKWLEKVMWRITHIVKSVYKRIDMTARDNEGQSRRIRDKLKKLNRDTSTVIKELRAEVNIEIENFSKELRTYLGTAQAKFRLCSVWKQEEIPQLSEKARNQEHWNWVKERVDLAFYNRLCALLEEWDTEGGKVEDIEEKLVTEVQSKLGILETEILDIESGMSSGSSVSSNGSSSKQANRRLSLGASKLVGQRPVLSSDMVAPKLSLGVKISTGNPLLKNLRNPRSRNFFNKNPEAWAKERAEKLLKKLVDKKKPKNGDSSILETLITHLMHRPIEYIDKIEQKIPSLAEANLTLLTRLEQASMQERGGLRRFGNVMEDIEGLRRLLMGYGEGYIFVNDFKINEIMVLRDAPGGQSFREPLRQTVGSMLGSYSTTNSLKSNAINGLWTIIVPGLLTKDNQERKISIKVYLPSSGVQNTFQEIAKLRCLLHKDIPIAEFLGIHHANAEIPSFVFDEELLSLQAYMQRNFDTKTSVRQIILEIAQGVAYIHSKTLVHMELTTTTVTVNTSGAVRLTGTCYPRRAILPLDKDNPVSNLVYLAPEVLQGNLYITPSDMFGFGLLLFELISNKQAFRHQRKFSFQEFVEKVNPVTMLPLDSTTRQWFSDEVFGVLCQCVSVDMAARPKMVDVVDILQEFKVDMCRRSSVRTATPAELFQRSRRSERNEH